MLKFYFLTKSKIHSHHSSDISPIKNNDIGQNQENWLLSNFLIKNEDVFYGQNDLKSEIKSENGTEFS